MSLRASALPLVGMAIVFATTSCGQSVAPQGVHTPANRPAVADGRWEYRLPDHPGVLLGVQWSDGHRIRDPLPDPGRATNGHPAFQLLPSPDGLMFLGQAESENVILDERGRQLGTVPHGPMYAWGDDSQHLCILHQSLRRQPAVLGLIGPGSWTERHVATLDAQNAAFGLVVACSVTRGRAVVAFSTEYADRLTGRRGFRVIRLVVVDLDSGKELRVSDLGAATTAVSDVEASADAAEMALNVFGASPSATIEDVDSGRQLGDVVAGQVRAVGVGGSGLVVTKRDESGKIVTELLAGARRDRVWYMPGTAFGVVTSPTGSGFVIAEANAAGGSHGRTLTLRYVAPSGVVLTVVNDAWQV